MDIKILPHPLLTNQFFNEKAYKKYIFLHHTAGASAQSAIEWWNSKPDRIATPFIIERDGAIYQNFDPALWSYALGVKGGTFIEKAAIHIEIVSYGGLVKEGDEFFTSTPHSKTHINPAEVVPMIPSYRGFNYFQDYTDAQVASVLALVPYLLNLFPSIKVQPSIKDFWLLRDLMDSKGIMSLPSGIWSHTTVRRDKSDIIPQQNLIEGLYGLFPHN